MKSVLVQENSQIEKMDAKLFQLLHKREEILKNEIRKNSSLIYNIQNHSKRAQKTSESIQNTTQKKIVKSILERKYVFTIVVAIVGSFALNQLLFYAEFDNYDAIYPDRYLIENLKGDKIDTHKHWKLSQKEPLKIKIVKQASVPDEKLELVTNAIFSDEIFDIPDTMTKKGTTESKSQYYLGWARALSTIGDTTFHVPKKFEILQNSDIGEGDITITLTNLKDSDGLSGLTKNIVTGDQILKSEITIYDASNISDNTLLSIVRHEFGHALGLSHSSAKEDLMFPELQTPFPYISDCTLGAISFLYEGNEQSEYTCEK